MSMKEWERIDETAGKTMREITRVWPNMNDLEPPHSFFLHEICEHLGWKSFSEEFTKELARNLRVGEIPEVITWLFEVIAELPHVPAALEDLLGTFVNGATADSVIKPLLESCEEKSSGFCAKLLTTVADREKIQLAKAEEVPK